ncbi:MAG: hypothetical protein HQ582_29465 [Planctomycetes bacterium]|nr:hypothetical protein [Planctomycetota bacterium]
MRNLRKKRFIDSPVQGALIRRIVLHWLVFFSVMLVVLPLWRIMCSGNLMGPFSKMMAESWVETAPAFIILLAMMPIFVWDTVTLSHRFAGPMYRFRKTLQELAARGEAAPVKLRNGDFWQDVADDFNAVLDRLAAEKARDASEDNPDLLACASCGDPASDAPSD